MIELKVITESLIVLIAFQKSQWNLSDGDYANHAENNGCPNLRILTKQKTKQIGQKSSQLVVTSF
jgi:hypothetical protein